MVTRTSITGLCNRWATQNCAAKALAAAANAVNMSMPAPKHCHLPVADHDSFDYGHDDFCPIALRDYVTTKVGTDIQDAVSKWAILTTVYLQEPSIGIYPKSTTVLYRNVTVGVIFCEKLYVSCYILNMMPYFVSNYISLCKITWSIMSFC